MVGKMQQARNARPITASNGPKRLSFQIGRRFGGVHGSATLLISNCFGVWSLRRRRYVKKTRFHRFYLLKTKAGPIAKQYASLRKLGMHSWPEYDERVTLWRSRLVDAYWGAAPAWYRERAVAYFRGVRRGRRKRRFVFCACAAQLAAVCLLVAKVAWSAVVPARTMFLYIVFGVCLLHIFGVRLWRETFDEPDVIVRMLEIV